MEMLTIIDNQSGSLSGDIVLAWVSACRLVAFVFDEQVVRLSR